MLIQFTVGNFLSFKEKVTLSMAKTAKHELPENVIKVSDDFGLLKSAAIYGANASGKTNLIAALAFMRFFAINSFKEYQVDEEIGNFNFRLSDKTKNESSFLEVVFLIGDITYRYGFEVDQKKVNKEWLYHISKTKEDKLFLREGSKFNIGNFPEGKGKESNARENCLFLSVLSQLNGRISSEIIKWFMRIRYISSPRIEHVISKIEEEPSLKKEVMKFISIADTGVKDFKIGPSSILSEKTESNITPKRKREPVKRLVYFIRSVFNDKKEPSGESEFNLASFDESEGTKRMFILSVPIINALRNGEIILIDEIENHLHPLLVKHVIKLFNSYSNNKNAQLIFATHNLTCMNNECFRRDQIWFTEKNSYNESSLFSLADYKIADKTIRKDENYRKNYLLGKYGAVPFIDEINLTFRDKDDGSSK